MPLVILILLFLLLLESTIVSIPITLSFLVAFLVIQKERKVLLLGVTAGLILDLLLVRKFGVTGMFFVTVLFLLMLYQRKFEIATYYFTAIAAFVAAFVYLMIFRVPHIFFQATIAAFLAILFFLFLTHVFARKEKPLNTI